MKIFYYFLLAAMAILYSSFHFNGLESHTGYFGLSYKLLHPESFSHDMYSSFHPAMISFYSLLVKMFGDIWLDDRFNFFFCTGLIFLSVLGIDKIAHLMGIQNRLGRLAILSIIMMEHLLVDNVPFLSDSYVYRPSSFAAPIGIWLAYFLLKGGKTSLLFFLSFLLVGFSFKNGWFPSLVTFLIVLRERFSMVWSKIFFASLTILLLIFVGHYGYQISHGTLEQTVGVFDLTMSGTENSEANPLQNGYGPILYSALLGLLFLIRKPPALLVRIRAISAISLIIYVGAALYYTLAPNWAKVPAFCALAVNRASWWPQVIGYTLLGSFLFGRFSESTSTKSKFLFGFCLIALYLSPMIGYLPMHYAFHTSIPIITSGKILIAAALFILVGLFLFLHQFRFVKLSQTWIAWPLLLTTLFYLSYKFIHRIPDLKFLAKHGIMGGIDAARWVGINEFFRNEAEKDAAVIAIAGAREVMGIDTSLKVRTGRSMPSGHEINFYFNYEKRKESLERARLNKNIVENWKACNLEEMETNLGHVGTPTYLVVPTESLCDMSRSQYSWVREINHFTILKRKG